VNVTPLSSAIGALVEGFDLAEERSEDAIGFVNDQLLRHQVLFFPEQSLTPQKQRDFARRFGDLHIHPIYPGTSEVPEIMVLDTHPDNPPDNDHWHTDVTFIETPPLGSLLYARRSRPSAAIPCGPTPTPPTRGCQRHLSASSTSSPRRTTSVRPSRRTVSPFRAIARSG
jgi:alpha-ketoglutarate-dependent taurine dioxygenase